MNHIFSWGKAAVVALLAALLALSPLAAHAQTTERPTSALSSRASRA